MNDKYFLDTNILLYCYAVTDPVKQAKAQAVAKLPNVIISTQVLKEFSNILRKKFKLDWANIRTALSETEDNFLIHTNTAKSIASACDIAETYRFSFYDSPIIVAALESGCSILYSEDMHSGQLIKGKLTIKNPF